MNSPLPYRLIELPERADPRGALTFGQQGDHIPFPVKRFFALYGVAPGATRGGHAHRAQHQLLVMLAGANALYFTLFDEAWVLKPGDDAPFTAKVVAVSAIALWLGVLYFGSMLPFLGNSF